MLNQPNAHRPIKFVLGGKCAVNSALSSPVYGVVIGAPLPDVMPKNNRPSSRASAYFQYAIVESAWVGNLSDGNGIWYRGHRLTVKYGCAVSPLSTAGSQLTPRPAGGGTIEQATPGSVN